MGPGTSTIVTIFSIIASTAALMTLQAAMFGRALDSLRNELRAELESLRNELGTRLDSIEGRLGRLETGLDRIGHRVTELERFR